MTPAAPLPENDLLLRAIEGHLVPRAPVWMMRQAGRSDPEYLAYRERAGLPLEVLFRSPEHAMAISLLPRRFGVDAIIIFQDILTPLAPMGAVFEFTPGPNLAEPLRHERQIGDLRAYQPGDALGFFAESIRGVLGELGGELPLLGFAGAPFTLAAFLIEGKSPGRMERTLAMAREQPAAFERLIDRLTTMTIDYLNFQAEAGVHAVQLFESVGDQIPRDLYETHAHPSHQRIFAGLKAGLPSILFVRESPFPELMMDSGAAVLSVGAGTSLKALLEQGAGRFAVQGNVDNRLLVEGTPEDVAKAVRSCLAETGGRSHILNLSHGLLPETPFENVLAFVQAARDTPSAAYLESAAEAPAG
ncbi:MAG: uroporphyrinogen decarboxylase family protein [SAR324 cluster bacterium]|nr:uroporphyrinogen decarboxylase family protein [SAR324 cluster bacterium]MCH8885285.1 uroporphyrinogen decarboxylase family protein [SAR324 cluster bacterium]